VTFKKSECQKVRNSQAQKGLSSSVQVNIAKYTECEIATLKRHASSAILTTIILTIHVFVPGATSFMGRAVIDELLATGYTVTCLALSDEAAAALTAKGVKVLGGSFRDFEIVKQRASKADGVIKLALNPVFSKYAQNCIDEMSWAPIFPWLSTKVPKVVARGLLVPTRSEPIASMVSFSSMQFRPRQSQWL
jgi:NADPH:quinone reductase-like Zn-dependent oxidoreductase